MQRILILFLLLPATQNLSAVDTDFAGGSECARCHAEQYQDWQGSHHDLAMAVAGPDSVLGNFDNSKFENFDVTSRFFMDEGRYMVRTGGPDGSIRDFQIKYTFGADPLQQYLVEFPGGRLQALDIAWDSRTKEQGGQRWFALHPDEKIDHKDVLHWTGPNMNWNYMCADCHSTNFQKKYDPESRTYASSWSEIDVNCEACHGPGSSHVRWANAGESKELAGMGLQVQLNERRNASWIQNTTTGLPERSAEKLTDNEIEVCAACHSRRGQLTDAWQPGQPLLDGFRPALLTEGLYHADGQIDDEVYVWGSFLQSKMYQTGVTCSDCHNPHSGELSLPGEQVCGQCHAASQYADKQHHFHEPGGTGSDCIECHMPAKKYMVIDARHDHSMRVPRPDLSITAGSPNSCINCHRDRSNRWAAEQVKAWYGNSPGGSQQYAPAFHAARNAEPGAASLLLTIANDSSQPVIARATAVASLAVYPGQQSFESIRQALSSDEALERMGALTALQSFGPRERALAFALLSDPYKSIRIQAARLLAATPAGDLPVEQKSILDDGIAEYIAAQKFNAERPESQTNLGGLFTELGRFSEAEIAYREAIKLQSQFQPAYAGLAQLYTAMQREPDALSVLDRGLLIQRNSALLHHARGLSLIRLQQTDKAMESLAKAARLEPDIARYSYVFAIALNSTGRTDMALGELASALRRHPQNRDILLALVTINRDAGNRDAAKAYAEKLLAVSPDDPAILELVKQL